MSGIHVGLMLPWIEIGLKNYSKKKPQTLSKRLLKSIPLWLLFHEVIVLNDIIVLWLKTWVWKLQFTCECQEIERIINGRALFICKTYMQTIWTEIKSIWILNRIEPNTIQGNTSFKIHEHITESSIYSTLESIKKISTTWDCDDFGLENELYRTKSHLPHTPIDAFCNTEITNGNGNTLQNWKWQIGNGKMCKFENVFCYLKLDLSMKIEFDTSWMRAKKHR